MKARQAVERSGGDEITKRREGEGLGAGDGATGRSEPSALLGHYIGEDQGSRS